MRISRLLSQQKLGQLTLMQMAQRLACANGE